MAATAIFFLSLVKNAYLATGLDYKRITFLLV